MDNLVVKSLTMDMVEDVFEIEKTFFSVSNNESILSSFRTDSLNYFVLCVNDEVIGFLECSVVLDESELYEIAISEKYQNRGYAKILMEHFIQFCKEKLVRTIFLEVNKNNSKAISLYQKYGFVEYFIRKNYYGENDAVLMKKLL